MKRTKIEIALIVFFSIGIVASIALTVLTFAEPSEPRHAVLAGFSLPRLFVGGVLILGALTFLGLLIAMARNARAIARLAAERLGRPGRIQIVFGALLISGLSLSVIYAVGAGGYFQFHFERLLPLSLWLVINSASALAGIALVISPSPARDLTRLTTLLILCIAGMLVFASVWKSHDARGEDIYYTYLEGERLIQGENPYARVIGRDLRENDKYATYFPGFYIISALSQKAGLSDFTQWIGFWQVLFMLAGLLIGCVVFSIPALKGDLIFAAFSAAFWLFNRWTMHIVRVSEMDFLALLMLVLSVTLLNRKPAWSYLLFGVSLSLKQMGFYLIPLFIIWAWDQRTHSRPRRSFAWSIVQMSIVPAILILPFLLWSAEGFINSVFISVSRNPFSLGGAQSVDALLGMTGLSAKLLMFTLFLAVYLLSYLKRVRSSLAVLLILMIFMGFNSVYFPSYFVWVIPFIPLTIYEYVGYLERSAEQDGNSALAPS